MARECWSRAVDPDGPAVGRLVVGDELKAIARGSVRVSVTGRVLMEEPDFVDTYEQYNAFLEEQDRLFHVLKAPAMAAITDRGTFELVPGGERPLSALPFVFWYQLVRGLIAGLTGLAVYAFRSRSAAAKAYALTGAASRLSLSRPPFTVRANSRLASNSFVRSRF